jgi:hypothetical protein
MEEHRLRFFDNRVLWKIIGPKRDEATVRSGGRLIIMGSMICTLQMLLE